MTRRFALAAVFSLAAVVLLAETRELAEFRTFIREHPRALDELKKDPALISDPAFAKSHDVVGLYLAKHPAVIEQVKAVPHFFENLTATTKGGEHKNHPEGNGGAKK
jgi:hypothetical protein